MTSSRPDNLLLSEKKLMKLQRLRRLSYLWDNSLGIPGTRFRLGLDALIGFLPFGGDAIGLLISSYILWQALDFGLPRQLFVQMVINVILDALVGTVPLLGDLLDTTWKANTRNVKLLEQHLQASESNLAKLHLNPWLLLVILFLLVGFCLGVVLLAIWLFQQVLMALTR